MEAQNFEPSITIISARYLFTTSAAIEKLTEEFNVLTMSIKVINEKLEMGYQTNDPPTISKSA